MQQQQQQQQQQSQQPTSEDMRAAAANMAALSMPGASGAIPVGHHMFVTGAPGFSAAPPPQYFTYPAGMAPQAPYGYALPPPGYVYTLPPGMAPPHHMATQGAASAGASMPLQPQAAVSTAPLPLPPPASSAPGATLSHSHSQSHPHPQSHPHAHPHAHPHSLPHSHTHVHPHAVSHSHQLSVAGVPPGSAASIPPGMYLAPHAGLQSVVHIPGAPGYSVPQPQHHPSFPVSASASQQAIVMAASSAPQYSAASSIPAPVQLLAQTLQQAPMPTSGVSSSGAMPAPLMAVSSGSSPAFAAGAPSQGFPAAMAPAQLPTPMLGPTPAPMVSGAGILNPASNQTASYPHPTGDPTSNSAARPAPSLRKRQRHDCICAICENSEDLMYCDGPCLRAFHASCINLPALTNSYQCEECQSARHGCFVCKQFTDATGSSARKCSAPNCGKHYHMSCVGSLPNSRLEGDKFFCPLHCCRSCRQSGKNQPSVRCARCPTSYHFKCLPTPFPIRRLALRRMVCPECLDKAGEKPDEPNTKRSSRRRPSKSTPKATRGGSSKSPRSRDDTPQKGVENVADVEEHGDEHPGGEEDEDENDEDEEEKDVEWVMCEDCSKWRTLPPEISAASLPDKWYCRMNTWDPEHSTCEAEEETVDSPQQKRRGRRRKSQGSQGRPADGGTAGDQAGGASAGLAPELASGTASLPEQQGKSGVPAVFDDDTSRETSAVGVGAPTTEGLSGTGASSSPAGHAGHSAQHSTGQATTAAPPPLTIPPAKGRGRPGKSSSGRTPRPSPTDAATKKGRSFKASDWQWIRCTNQSCGKLRKLPLDVKKSDLPPNWTCDLNQWEPELANCDAPEDIKTGPSKKKRGGGRTPNAANRGRGSGQGKANSRNKQWVQCEHPSCGKWRVVPPDIDLKQLAKKKWYCDMNTWDESQASCDAPEDYGGGGGGPSDAPTLPAAYVYSGIGGGSGRNTGRIDGGGQSSSKVSYRDLIFGAWGGRPRSAAAVSNKNAVTRESNARFLNSSVFCLPDDERATAPRRRGRRGAQSRTPKRSRSRDDDDDDEHDDDDDDDDDADDDDDGDDGDDANDSDAKANKEGRSAAATNGCGGDSGDTSAPLGPDGKPVVGSTPTNEFGTPDAKRRRTTSGSGAELEAPFGSEATKADIQSPGALEKDPFVLCVRACAAVVLTSLMAVVSTPSPWCTVDDILQIAKITARHPPADGPESQLPQARLFAAHSSSMCTGTGIGTGMSDSNPLHRQPSERVVASENPPQPLPGINCHDPAAPVAIQAILGVLTRMGFVVESPPGALVRYRVSSKDVDVHHASLKAARAPLRSLKPWRFPAALFTQGIGT